MLLGTDDYMECQDAAQHGLLNFGAADSFTFLVAMRIWATSASGRIMMKGNGLAGLGFYYFRVEGTTTTATLALVDGLGTVATSTSPASSYGSQSVFSTTVNRTNQTMNANAGTTTNSATAIRNIGNSSNFQTLRVGGTAASLDAEFRAAAIWRRALTSREIAVLNNAAPWGA